MTRPKSKCVPGWFFRKRQLARQIPVYGERGERDLRKYLHFTIQLDCLLTAYRIYSIVKIFISKNKSHVFPTIIVIGRIVIRNLDLISNHYLGGGSFWPSDLNLMEDHKKWLVTDTTIYCELVG